MHKNWKWLPYGAKFLSGKTIRRAKFSSLKEQFDTFARQKISPNKSKSVLNEVQVNLRGKQVIQTNFDYLVD